MDDLKKNWQVVTNIPGSGAEPESGTAPGSCLESIPLLASSIPITGIPTQYLNLSWNGSHIPVPCPPNCSSVRAVFSLQNYLQQAISLHESIVLPMKTSTMLSSNNLMWYACTVKWHHIKAHFDLVCRPYPGGVASRLAIINFVAMVMPILYDNFLGPNNSNLKYES